MIKVGFKGDFMKVKTFNDKCIVVTMVGKMTMPIDLWQILPNDVASWMWNHPSIDASWGDCTKQYEELRLEFSGKAVCHDEDSFDEKTGKRIAESRAKIRLYKFIHTLLYKLHVYYFGITFGDRYAICDIGELADYDKPGGIFEEMGKYKSLLDKETLHLEKLLEET